MTTGDAAAMEAAREFLALRKRGDYYATDATEIAALITLREAAVMNLLMRAYSTLAEAHLRIHGLPRTADTDLARKIEVLRSDIHAAIRSTAPQDGKVG